MRSTRFTSWRPVSSRPDVLDPPQALDDGAVEVLPAPQDLAPGAQLRPGLSQGQGRRQRHGRQHDQADTILYDRHISQGASDGNEARDQLVEGDGDEQDQPVHAAGDPALKGTRPLAGQHRQVGLEQVGRGHDRHVALDAGAGALDEAFLADLQQLADQVAGANQGEEGARDQEDRPPAGAVIQGRRHAGDEGAEEHRDGSIEDAVQEHDPHGQQQHDLVPPGDDRQHPGHPAPRW